MSRSGSRSPHRCEHGCVKEISASTWRQIADTKLTPAERHAIAWRSWRDAGSQATLVASRFACACMIAGLNARQTTGPLAPAQPDPIQTAPIREASRLADVDTACWNHLAGLVASFDIDVPDPSLNDELVTIAAEFEGDAGFMFGYYGKAAIHDFAAFKPDDFQARYQWVRNEIERLDATLFE